MKKAYRYLALSPRGFLNEIEFTAKCDSKEEMWELEELYLKVYGNNAKAWIVESKEAYKEKYIAEASDILKQYKTEGNWQEESEKQAEAWY